MIKILFFLPTLAGGGAERTIVNIANGLDKDRYDVFVVVIDRPNSGKYKDAYSGLLNQEIHLINLAIPIRYLNYPKIAYKTRKAIERISPDIVMSTMLKTNVLIIIALICSKFHGKCIIRESNNRSVEITSSFTKKFIRELYNRGSDKIVALSEGVKYDLTYYFGIKPSKVRVIYNPIDLENIERKSQGYIKQSSTDVIKIIAVGRLHPQKDYPTMIRALSELKGNYKFEMKILGTGPLKKEIEELIQELGMEGMISLLGFKDNPYQFLAQSDIFILSSAWEGFGHVIVEAMACGAAVIATDCNYGPGEIITNGENGILVPIGDIKELKEAIEKVMTNNNLRKELTDNGKKRAKDFDKKIIVQEYMDLFENLVQK